MDVWCPRTSCRGMELKSPCVSSFPCSCVVVCEDGTQPPRRKTQSPVFAGRQTPEVPGHVSAHTLTQTHTPCSSANDEACLASPSPPCLPCPVVSSRQDPWLIHCPATPSCPGESSSQGPLTPTERGSYMGCPRKASRGGFSWTGLSKASSNYLGGSSGKGP